MIIKKYNVSVNDEYFIRAALNAMPSKGSNPPDSFKDRLITIANTYPGFALDFQNLFGTMPKLPSRFECNITPDNKFNCMFT